VGVDRVELCGLATDYCVAYSALDAVAAGFEVVLHEAACGGIDPDGVGAQLERMRAAGVQIV
jgi:nicotinamidase/pyrazinamidase